MNLDFQETQLVSQCLAGSRRAFESLYALHSRAVSVFFLRSGFSGELSDDLTQETFIRVMKSLATFDAQRGGFRQWVGAIARNVARKHWARRSDGDNFDPELAEETLADPGDPSRSPEAREETQAVRDCVGHLPGELAEIIRLRFVEGLTTRAVGQRMDMPEATIRLRLEQARALLAQCLKSKGFLE